jgi:hypothetical protein
MAGKATIAIDIDVARMSDIFTNGERLWRYRVSAISSHPTIYL